MDFGSEKLEELLKVKDEYLSLSKGVIDYDKFNHYSIVHHGTSIEGSSLDLSETYLLLDEGLTPKNKPLVHSLMNVDHYKALIYVIELAERKEKLKIEYIQKMSSLILKSTGGLISAMAGDFDSSKGEFRKATVRAGNRTFMDYSKVSEKVQQLIDYINDHISEARDYLSNSLLAYDIHFQMVSIHPFADGNGRLSRLMMNYVQHYGSYPLTVVFKEDKKEYYEALENTRQSGNIEVFRNFMLNQSHKYFTEEILHLSKVQKQVKGKGMSFIF